MTRLPMRQAYLERLVPKAEGRIICSYLGSSARMISKVRPQGPNFILNDFMGLNISIALGMAVARPDKSVIVLEGDGGLLMKLETLVTAAAKAPPNLLVVTFFNGWYITGGRQPLPAPEVNLEDFARAARFPQTATADTLDGFDAALDRMLESGRLGYINLRVKRETPEQVENLGVQPPRPLEMRANFTRWIQENPK